MWHSQLSLSIIFLHLFKWYFSSIIKQKNAANRNMSSAGGQKRGWGKSWKNKKKIGGPGKNRYFSGGLKNSGGLKLCSILGCKILQKVSYWHERSTLQSVAGQTVDSQKCLWTAIFTILFHFIPPFSDTTFCHRTTFQIKKLI